MLHLLHYVACRQKAILEENCNIKSSMFVVQYSSSVQVEVSLVKFIYLH